MDKAAPERGPTRLAERKKAMLDILNGLIQALLFGAVAYLVYDRWKRRSTEEEKPLEEWVTQSELDSYHHRVVQLYQTQRDWTRGKYEEVDHRLRILENKSQVVTRKADPGPAPDAVLSAPSEGVDTPPVLQAVSPPERVPVAQPSPESPIPAPSAESVTDMESFKTAEEKVLRAWAQGQSIDRIAQDLRMGRQEVQLLIQVSRRRPAASTGV